MRDLAEVWNPREIEDISVQRRVLERMRSAERGLRRLKLRSTRPAPKVWYPFSRQSGSRRWNASTISKPSNESLLIWKPPPAASPNFHPPCSPYQADPSR